jgi:hypothetical protein
MRAVEVALVALVAERVVRVPLKDALLTEQRAAILTVLADLTSDGSGTAESDAKRHNVTLCGAPDRPGHGWQPLHALTLNCMPLHIAYLNLVSPLSCNGTAL